MRRGYLQITIAVSDDVKGDMLKQKAAEAAVESGLTIEEFERRRAGFPGNKCDQDIGFIIHNVLKSMGIGEVR